MSHLMAHLLCPAQRCMPTMHPAPQPHVQGPQIIPAPGQEQACTFSLLFLQKPCSGGFSCRGQQQQHISALAQGSPPSYQDLRAHRHPPSSHPLWGLRTPVQGTGPGCCSSQPQQPGALPLQCNAAHGGSIPTSGSRPTALFGEEADAPGASAPSLIRPPLCHISLQSRNAHRP